MKHTLTLLMLCGVILCAVPVWAHGFQGHSGHHGGHHHGGHTGFRHHGPGSHFRFPPHPFGHLRHFGHHPHFR